MNGADEHTPPTKGERDAANLGKIVAAVDDFHAALRAANAGAEILVRMQLFTGGVLEVRYDREVPF